MSAPIPARYFDGQTSRLYHVTLGVDADQAVLAGDVERRCPLAQLHVSERTSHAVRKVSFPDGAYLEITDQAAFNDLLHASGHRDSLVVLCKDQSSDCLHIPPRARGRRGILCHFSPHRLFGG